MSSETSELRPAYLFDLHMLCGGYAYFSSFSGWRSTGEHGREKRQPEAVDSAKVAEVINHLEETALWITTESDFDYWLCRRGWAFVDPALVETRLQHWIQVRECVRDACGSYTDIRIASKEALKPQIADGRRQRVLKRDGGRCLACGKNDRTLTMHHVIPFSRGGETTTRNLVALCKECNQSIGRTESLQFYALAGLPHGFDASLLRGERATSAVLAAIRLSGDLLHTRASI